ncbi:MAG TPA: alpha/beta fold hydrolase [Gaiellaceae bacterium]|nr:alpha/beta fold hydrolase [Gaiellaceae bacterium]
MELPVPGGRLYVEEHGSRPGSAGRVPLLLIQGLGYSMWAWRYQLDAFDRRTIAFDNRGAGRSSKEPGPFSMEQFADDAVAVLDALGVEAAHVLGLSMGTFVAQSLALRAPERVRSLVLVGGSPGGPEHAPVPAETLDAWAANAHLPPVEFVRRTMHFSYSPGWSEANPELFEELMVARLEHPTPPECWRAQFEATIPFLRAGAAAEEIAVPVLVVHGELDRVVPVSNGRLLARRIPGAELVVLPGCGHVVPLERPDELNRLVSDFLDRVEAQ